jgi:hypothetical protein
LPLVQPSRPLSVTSVCNSAPACPAVVATAGEEQLVGIGAATVGPVRRVVHLAPIARFEAIGPGAAAVAGIADESLVGGGDAFLAAQI